MPFNCSFVLAVCIVVRALMLLVVDVVNCKRPNNVNSKESKQEKYEDFKCYDQSLTQTEMERVVWDPDDKPKGCIALTGCRVKYGKLNVNGTQKHDLRTCVEKKFLKSLKKEEGIDIDADELCAFYVDQLNFCDGCKVCHPKKGHGDYCNGDGTNEGGTTEGSPDTTEASPPENGGTAVLVSILPFGATAIGAIWMRFGI